jgi:hypothetical protein
MTTTLASPSQDYHYLDIDSVKKVCCSSDQVVVYGWSHCNYREVYEDLTNMCSQAGSSVKKVFDWQMGYPLIRGMDFLTLEGRKLNIIHFERSTEKPQVASRPCKTAMVNLVLENVKRLREKKAPIPMIFCQDIDNNPRPFKPTDMISKDQDLNKLITHKELRRAYKLCTYENTEIRTAALATFKFVHLKDTGHDTVALQSIAAPWDAPHFSLSWKARKKNSKSKEDNVNWRKQLETQVKNIPAPASASTPLAAILAKTTVSLALSARDNAVRNL